METFNIAIQNDVQNSTINEISDIDTFWDPQGPVLEYYQERGKILSSVCYTETLRDQL
jgi:hypothetical protein